jgi:hypothetical protein
VEYSLLEVRALESEVECTALEVKYAGLVMEVEYQAR